MSNLESIVVEIRRTDDEGPYSERIKFLPDERLRAEGIDLLLTDSDEVLHVVLKDKVIV